MNFDFNFFFLFPLVNYSIFSMFEQTERDVEKRPKWINLLSASFNNDYASPELVIQRLRKRVSILYDSLHQHLVQENGVQFVWSSGLIVLLLSSLVLVEILRLMLY
jgi:hypothetical protein